MPAATDVLTDVLVVGYGFAGGAAAVVAADYGAEVTLIEKMPFPGGLSVTSGGGLAIAADEDAVFEYLRRTNLNTTPDPVLRAMARGMVELPDFVRHLERGSGEEVKDERAIVDPNAHATYDFPGADTIRSMKIAPSEGLNQAIPWVKGMRGGARLFKLLMDNVKRRPIDVRLCTAAEDLLVTSSGEVAGAVVRQEAEDGTVSCYRIQARRGVILACGGFEHDEEMKLQYFNLQPVYGVTGLGNTGDGVRMCQKLGAKLWHMWHFHGGYGFRPPAFQVAFRHWVSGPRVPTRKMQWILLDKYGRRFMNEYPPAVQDTGARELAYYDTERTEYPRIPAYMVFDEQGRKHHAIGFPIFQGEDQPYEWSEDNSREVEQGWIHRAETLEDLASQLGIPCETVRQTIERYNRFVEQGEDEDFDRPAGTMMPICTPPFYWVHVWPIVSNTQGGPAHDELQRVLRADEQPLPRLYAVGELGSLFGHLYLEAGNVSECFVGGRIAGAHAAQQSPLHLDQLTPA